MGTASRRPTGNALLDRLLGAEVRYVATRQERAPAMEAAAAELTSAGGVPFVIPIGASTPLGAAAFVLAVAELLEQVDPPDVIVHSTSSGGTQAGLVAGLRDRRCRDAGARHQRRRGGAASLARGHPDGSWTGSLELGLTSPLRDVAVEIDDRFVGEGYGIPTPESRDALELAARTEAIFLDPTYTAKAMAGTDRASADAGRSTRRRRCSSGTPAARWRSSPEPGPPGNATDFHAGDRWPTASHSGFSAPHAP